MKRVRSYKWLLLLPVARTFHLSLLHHPNQLRTYEFILGFVSSCDRTANTHDFRHRHLNFQNAFLRFCNLIYLWFYWFLSHSHDWSHIRAIANYSRVWLDQGAWKLYSSLQRHACFDTVRSFLNHVSFASIFDQLSRLCTSLLKILWQLSDLIHNHWRSLHHNQGVFHLYDIQICVLSKKWILRNCRHELMIAHHLYRNERRHFKFDFLGRKLALRL